jgi:hypothetical protein
MDTPFLNVRLSAEDQHVIERLQKSLGLSKSAIVKRALHSLASAKSLSGAAGGLFELGEGRFGQYGSSTRQAADIKRIARTRAFAKRSGR